MTTHRTPAPAKPRRPRRARAAAVPPIVERPDGYYWIGDGELGEFGPFESYELARTDRDAGSEQAPAAREALQEAERDIGLSAWPEPAPDDPDATDSRLHLPEE